MNCADRAARLSFVLCAIAVVVVDATRPSRKRLLRERLASSIVAGERGVYERFTTAWTALQLDDDSAQQTLGVCARRGQRDLRASSPQGAFERR